MFVTLAADLHTKPSATAVSTIESVPTEVERNDSTAVSFVSNEAASEPAENAGPITAADGFIATDATLSPFDVDQPAVGNLNRDLLAAIQRATTDAAADGIAIRINSGWRSARYQQQLLNEAVVTYGSDQEARKWVDTPGQSAHVAGDAVDVAPTEADDWLLLYGNRYGLCQIYANEIWHFELATEPGARCPRPKIDASGG
jgi:LAS superfamily LD-carboxypeptidase LdcB